MTVAQALRWGAAKLTGDTAILDAELLLATALRQPRSYLYIHDHQRLPFWAWWRYTRFLNRRTQAEPVAYITGTKEFYNLEFTVNRHVLIPRPETEELVELVMRYCGTHPRATVADIGTGSGCIAVTLKKNFPLTTIIASDISTAALDVAKANADRYGADITFVHSDLLEKIPAGVDLFVANLPYLTIAETDIVPAEPRLALDSGQDGLNHYRRLLGQLASRWQTSTVAMCEIGYAQADGFRAIAAATLPNVPVRILPDRRGLDRFAILGEAELPPATHFNL